jgi:hypothetical protein
MHDNSIKMHDSTIKMQVIAKGRIIPVVEWSANIIFNHRKEATGILLKLKI